jgi:magnesium chelatase family protein
MPRQKIVISMAPAGIRKQGALFDLPIALSILAESGQIDPVSLDGCVSVGELSLNGLLRPVKGVLSMALQAHKQGFKRMLVPAENASEAALAEGLEVFGLPDLKSAFGFLSGLKVFVAEKCGMLFSPLNQDSCGNDFSDIKGQPAMKRAMEIAAEGGHNILMIGSPGSGKTMVARRLSTILPPLTLQESLEITRLYSISGKLENKGLALTRPFRAPHHTASNIALVGGGSNAQPGEISLAHNGVLFLDELPEFERKVLEVLRQPLEDRLITISRASFNNTYPAGFIFVAAMNPCPCGFYKNRFRTCTCTETMIRKYARRISGPLLDRIDLHVNVSPVKYSELSSKSNEPTSSEIRARVTLARDRQILRAGGIINAQMTAEQMKHHCRLATVEEDLLMQAMEKQRLSARSYDRILKIARTIADLDGANNIALVHLSEAIGYRCFDREYFCT